MTTRRMPAPEELEVLGHCGADFDTWPRCHCEHPDGGCMAVADFRTTFTYPTYGDDGAYEDTSPSFFCRECMIGIISEKARYRRLDILPLRPR